MKRLSPKYTKSLGLITEPRWRWIILFTWLCVHAWIAWHRSLWMDELSRIEHIEKGSLWLALKDVMLEPSPFTPGEIVFLYFFKTFFSGSFPLELWLRGFSLLQGLLCVWVGLRSRAPYLWLFVIFSSSLTSHATQARPYSALFLAGAWLYWIFFERPVLSGFERFLLRAQIFFTHVYGLLFLGLALWLRRDRLWACIAACYAFLFSAVYVTLHHGKISEWSGTASFPPPGEFIRQISGVLGNPHKASLLFLPLSLWGVFVLIRQERRKLFKFALYFAITVGAPLAAILAGKYAFFPRQIVGATFGFLGLALLGLERLPAVLRPFALAVLLVFAAIRPWINCSIRGIPPFPDVAFHRYRDVIASIGREDVGRNVLILDAAGTYPFYLKRLYGPPQESRTDLRLPRYEETPLQRDCWNERYHFCVYTYRDSSWTWTATFDVPPLSVVNLINSRELRFSKVIGPQWASFHPDDPSLRMLRDW